MFHFKKLAAAAFIVLGAATPSLAQERFITVASTTSTEQSGLFGHLLPKFKEKSGIDVRVVAQGTGQALDTGRRGDADVVLVHDQTGEEKFVADGSGVKRFPVMYNDFIIVGPKSDPARVRGMKDVVAAFKQIAGAKALFASRGDDSGTDRAEKRLWKQAQLEPKSGSDWYKSTGSGMGQTLNTSASLNAYTLADRATWLAFKNRGDLEIVVEGDAKLFNQYGVILVNPEKHPSVKKADGEAFIDWLVSDAGQATIAGYKINGEQLFFPNAKGSS